jgi:DNA mismatch endonuclease (patch repair protein)
MSKIRSKGTKIELRMKVALEKSGIEFEYQPRMLGRPDFLIPPDIAVFCDSSFWHGRNWRKLRTQLPKEYWYDHINRNRLRDRAVNSELRKKGYSVLRFWDSDIENNIEKCIARINELRRRIEPP